MIEDTGLEEGAAAAEGEFPDAGGGEAMGRASVGLTVAGIGIELVVVKETITLIEAGVIGIEGETAREAALESGFDGVGFDSAGRIGAGIERVIAYSYLSYQSRVDVDSTKGS